MCEGFSVIPAIVADYSKYTIQAFCFELPNENIDRSRITSKRMDRFHFDCVMGRDVHLIHFDTAGMRIMPQSIKGLS